MKKEERQILEGLVKLKQIPLLPETTEPENTPSPKELQNNMNEGSPIVLAVMREHPYLTYDEVEEMLNEM